LEVVNRGEGVFEDGFDGVLESLEGFRERGDLVDLAVETELDDH
jgi:hypothetical protein